MTVYAEQKANPHKNGVHFQWAFGAITKGKSGSQFKVITRDMVLKSGDQIKFFLRPKDSSFLYFIHHGSQGKLNVLYPETFKPLRSDFKRSEPHYVPPGVRSFKLDDYVGKETFYLLASAKRLFDLELLINNYESADKTKKSYHRKKILEEIQRLRRRQLKTYAERPVSAIGNVRAPVEDKTLRNIDLSNFAVEISAKDLYSRVFTIDHK